MKWAVMFLLAALFPAQAAARIAPWDIGQLKDQPAPAFTLPDPAGQKTMEFAATHGKVVLLNFWATWCSPCREEIAALNRLQQHFAARGFTVIGISIDDKAATVRAFLKKQPISFPVLHDEGQVVNDRYKVYTYPTSFLVDRTGVIRAFYLGIQKWQGEAITAAIEKLLRAPAPGKTAPSGAAQ